jgi:hypothetical protein
MHSATISFRKYFSKQIFARISSHLTARKLILRYPRVRLNLLRFRKMFELLAYNGAFGTTPYSGAGLEMYFYCNYGDEYE